MRSGFGPYERALLCVLSAVCAAIALANPSFLSPENIADLLSAATVLGLFALGEFLVMLAGGIDISFTAIGACSLYVTAKIFASGAPDAPLWLPPAAAVGIGTILGLLNALFVVSLNLPALIVTLGTAGLFHGLLLTFVGTRMITDLPACLTFPATYRLIEFSTAGGQRVGLPLFVLSFPLCALAAHIFLQRTLLGRGVYAFGGNAEAARRVGFPVARIQFLVYALLGSLAGAAGMIHAARMRNANPFDLVGSELDVIAAVVLGGASITGGRGSVPGLLCGVGLFVVVTRSLILLGVPSSCQRVVVGGILVASAAATGALKGGRSNGGQ